jgi:DNA-binding XRE family transcriptional regulator
MPKPRPASPPPLAPPERERPAAAPQGTPVRPADQIDYSDIPDTGDEPWADASPLGLYADVWEAELARRVGRLARTRRLALGLTQEEVAARAGVPQPNVARVEAGRHLPTVATLARLAVALGLTWHVDVTPQGARIAVEVGDGAGA